jgi:hypothetical protein
MSEKGLGQKSRCCPKEERNAGLDVFKGLLAGKEINLTYNISTDPVIIRGSMTSQLQVCNVTVNTPFN